MMMKKQKDFSFSYALPYNDFGQHLSMAVEPAISSSDLVQFAKDIELGTKLKASGNNPLDGAWNASSCSICVKAVKHAKCAVACYDCVISTKGCSGTMVEIN